MPENPIVQDTEDLPYVPETPEDDPPADDPPAPEITDERRREIALAYASDHPDQFRGPQFDPPAPRPDPEPDEPPVTATPGDTHWIYDPEAADRTLDEKLARAVSAGNMQLMRTLAPLIGAHAEATLVQQTPEAARPYVDKIAQELKVDRSVLALDPTSARIVRQAAIGAAIEDGKYKPEFDRPSGGEPTSGVPSPLSEEETLAAQAYYEVTGKKPTEKEVKQYLQEAARA